MSHSGWSLSTFLRQSKNFSQKLNNSIEMQITKYVPFNNKYNISLGNDVSNQQLSQKSNP